MRGRLYGSVRDARKTRREREAPVFRGGWKNICIHPRPSLPLYRPRDSSISAPASPYSEVSPAEATFVPSLCFFLPAFNPLSLFLSFLSLLLYLYLCASFLILLFLLLSVSLFPFLFPRGRSSSHSFLLVGAMCIRKYESFVALSTTAFLELSTIVHE